MARAAVSQSSGDQLAWDFDDPDAGEAPAPVENEGAAVNVIAPQTSQGFVHPAHKAIQHIPVRARLIPVGRRAAVHGR